MTEREDYRTQKIKKDKSGAAIRLGVLGLLGAAAIAGGAYVWSADVDPIGTQDDALIQQETFDQYASTTPQTTTDATNINDPLSEEPDAQPAAIPEPQREAAVTPRRAVRAPAPVQAPPAPVEPPGIVMPAPVVTPVPDAPLPQSIMPIDPAPAAPDTAAPPM